MARAGQRHRQLLLTSLLVACAGRPGGTLPEPEPLEAKTSPSDALYFLLVDRFADGRADPDGSVDPSNPQAWHGGDLAGVHAHLDHLQDLGVGGVWLSPITKTRTEPIDEWGAYHGYWVADLGAVEPRFGTEADAVALSEALRARGMTLWLDMVYNHVGYDTPLLEAHPDWFHGKGDIVDWHDPEQVVTHDVHGLPDLAQEKDPVYDHLLEASAHWVRTLQPTGFRVDAVRHMPEGFLARLREDLRKIDPELQLLGEVFEGHAGKLAARQRADQLDRVFDFPLHYAMKDVFCGDAHTGRIASMWSTDSAYADANRLVTFLDNHDVSRIASACGGDEARIRRAVAFLTVSRGTPCITWGTEAPLLGDEEPANRGDMVFDREEYRGGIADTLRSGLSLRARWPALRDGVTRIDRTDAHTLVFRRVLVDEQVLVVVHLSEEPMDLAPVRELLGDASIDASLTLGEQGFEPLTGDTLASSVAVFHATPRPPNRFEHLLVEPPASDVTLRSEGAPLRDGDSLVLVGAGAALGDWDPDKGVVAAEGAFTVRAALGEVLAFKQVIRHADGTATWEDAPDRYHRVTSPDAGSMGWGYAHSGPPADE